MKNHVRLCCLLIVLFCCISLLAWASPPHRYQMPTTLTLDIQPQEPLDFRKGVKVKVLVQSKIGTLKNVELKFHTGSQRLVADQTVLSIPEIRENATEEIIVNLRQTGASGIKAGDRWFAVYYSYQPDYQSLREYVKTSTKDYPDDSSRASLLRSIKSSEQKNNRWRGSLTYDFE